MPLLSQKKTTSNDISLEFFVEVVFLVVAGAIFLRGLVLYLPSNEWLSLGLAIGSSLSALWLWAVLRHLRAIRNGGEE